jgi:hypothetical protein
MKPILTIYRASPETLTNAANKCRPDFFSKKKCFKSFFDNFNEISDIVVIFDGDEQDDFAAHLKKFQVKDIVFFNNQNVGLSAAARNMSLFTYARKYCENSDNAFFWITEDDFLYNDFSQRVLAEGINKLGRFGSIVLYDHPDRYFSERQDETWGKEHIFLTQSVHWRTAESSNTFGLISKEVFNHLYPQFNYFCTDNDPEKIQKFGLGIKECAFFQEFRRLGFHLFSPMPGCATHMNKYQLSPLADWERINSDILL